MSAVDVYDKPFNVLEAHYVTFYIQRVASLHSLALIYFIIKLQDTNKYIIAIHADKYVEHILIRPQFTTFSHISTAELFTKNAYFEVRQMNYLNSFTWTFC